METLSMARHEVEQIPIIENLKNKTIRQKHASKMLGLSIRQVQRKLHNYRKIGAKALIHGNRGKPSNRQLDPGLVKQSLDLIENHYPDFSPTFAAEKLFENHGIAINHETLRQKMIIQGLWFSKQKKMIHRQWRERRSCLGELVQLDGSPHKWFEDRAPSCTLIAFIDDASSKILHLEFMEEEATIPVMQATKNYLNGYGRPLEIYVDRGKVFKVNLHNPDNDKITQYRRALEELDIKTIYARSPQAKGRVERLFGTLQNRLVKELRLAGISNIKAANQFVKDIYLSKHNEKFAVEAKEKQNFHRSIENYDLNEIFTLREERILNNDFTLRYYNRWFQLIDKQPTLIFPKNIIIVKRYLNQTIKFQIRNTKLNFQEISKPTTSKINPINVKVKSIKKPWIPPVDHPWRQYKVNYQQNPTFLNC